MAKKKQKAQVIPANVIKIACRGASLIDLDRLIHFQGKLKALSEANYMKFKNQMITLGFSEPISVWKNGDDHNVLNGHQRLAVLKRLRDQEGYSIPAIPINLVDATDIKEAKKKVLALTSHYGDMTTESLGNFLIDADLDLGDLRNDFRFLDVEIEPLPEVEFSNDPDRSANTKSAASNSTAEMQLTEYKNERSDAETHHADLADHIEIDDGESDEEPDPDPVDDLPQITIDGDLWILGDHKIYCGDSTSTQNVSSLFGDDKADICFTSPPYAQQRIYDKKAIDDWDKLMIGVYQNMPLKSDGQIFVNLGMVHRDCEWIPYWDNWINFMRADGWRRFGLYVWDQGPGQMGDWHGRLAPSFEFIFHFNKASKQPNKVVEKKPENITDKKTGNLRNADGTVPPRNSPHAGLQTHKIEDNVIRVMRHKGRSEHPAVFPIKLPEKFLLSYTDEGQVCYEPFLGSGTTIIAAEQTGRRCFGMEQSPKYCDIAIRRWQQITGKQAIHAESKLAFDDIIND